MAGDIRRLHGQPGGYRPVVNLALEAGASYLVTWDADLLDLMDIHRPEGKAFRAKFPDLVILDPVAFLRVLVPT